mgnify:CR=1 FL=1
MRCIKCRKKKSILIECKYCKADIDLRKQKKLPKKKILERYGLCWAGIETVFLNIYKVQCDSCKKKFTHKVFRSEYLYK